MRPARQAAAEHGEHAEAAPAEAFTSAKSLLDQHIATVDWSLLFACHPLLIPLQLPQGERDCVCLLRLAPDQSPDCAAHGVVNQCRSPALRQQGLHAGCPAAATAAAARPPHSLAPNRAQNAGRSAPITRRQLHDLQPPYVNVQQQPRCVWLPPPLAALPSTGSQRENREQA